MCRHSPSGCAARLWKWRRWPAWDDESLGNLDKMSGGRAEGNDEVSPNTEGASWAVAVAVWEVIVGFVSIATSFGGSCFLRASYLFTEVVRSAYSDSASVSASIRATNSPRPSGCLTASPHPRYLVPTMRGSRPSILLCHSCSRSEKKAGQQMPKRVVAS